MFNAIIVKHCNQHNNSLTTLKHLNKSISTNQNAYCNPSALTRLYFYKWPLTLNESRSWTFPSCFKQGIFLDPLKFDRIPNLKHSFVPIYLKTDQKRKKKKKEKTKCSKKQFCHKIAMFGLRWKHVFYATPCSSPPNPYCH